MIVRVGKAGVYFLGRRGKIKPHTNMAGNMTVPKIAARNVGA